MPNNHHDHMRYLILNMIYRFGPISRTELIAITDYRPASVGEIIKELLAEQLIVETGRLSTGHGRKRTLLELNKSFICSIGISITSKCVTTVMAQLDGEILNRFEDEIDDLELKGDLTDRIVNRVQELLAANSDRRIVGIGIGDPLYDPSYYTLDKTLVSNYNHFNDWVHFILKPKLERASGLLVKSMSPVTLPALMEMRFGVARGVRDFICVELSNGIGASICANGSVIAGANNVAGELGHTVVDLSGRSDRLCYCGKPGCVETSTAYPALVRDIKDALNRGVYSSLSGIPDVQNTLGLADIRRALDEGDATCRFYVAQAARRIGTAIANAVNLLNPELVVLYGFMLDLGDFFLDELSKSIHKNVLVLAKNFEIKVSASLESSIPLGAAAEMFTIYLRSDDYKWIYRLVPEHTEAAEGFPAHVEAHH